MRRLQISNRGRIALFSVVFGIPLYVVGRISPVPPLEPLRGEIGDVLVARARRDLLDQNDILRDPPETTTTTSTTTVRPSPENGHRHADYSFDKDGRDAFNFDAHNRPNLRDPPVTTTTTSTTTVRPSPENGSRHPDYSFDMDGRDDHHHAHNGPPRRFYDVPHVSHERPHVSHEPPTTTVTTTTVHHWGRLLGKDHDLPSTTTTTTTEKPRLHPIRPHISPFNPHYPNLLTDTDAPATTTTTTTTTPRPRSHTVGVRGQEHENLHQRFRWRDPPPSTTTQATTTILPWPSNGLPGHRHNMPARPRLQRKFEDPPATTPATTTPWPTNGRPSEIILPKESLWEDPPITTSSTTTTTPLPFPSQSNGHAGKSTMVLPNRYDQLGDAPTTTTTRPRPHPDRPRGPPFFPIRQLGDAPTTTTTTTARPQPNPDRPNGGPPFFPNRRPRPTTLNLGDSRTTTTTTTLRPSAASFPSYPYFPNQSRTFQNPRTVADMTHQTDMTLRNQHDANASKPTESAGTETGRSRTSTEANETVRSASDRTPQETVGNGTSVEANEASANDAGRTPMEILKDPSLNHTLGNSMGDVGLLDDLNLDHIIAALSGGNAVFILALLGFCIVVKMRKRVDADPIKDDKEE